MHRQNSSKSARSVKYIVRVLFFLPCFVLFLKSKEKNIVEKVIDGGEGCDWDGAVGGF